MIKQQPMVFIHPETNECIVEQPYPIQSIALDSNHIAYRGDRGFYKLVCFKSKQPNASFQSYMIFQSERIECKDCNAMMDFKEPMEE